MAFPLRGRTEPLQVYALIGDEATLQSATLRERRPNHVQACASFASPEEIAAEHPTLISNAADRSRESSKPVVPAPAPRAPRSVAMTEIV